MNLVQLPAGLLVSALFLWPLTSSAATKSYASGSLIIPMDTNYQASGMFNAYGLVYRLLSNGVPVDWAIKQGKAFGDEDFSASFRDLGTLTNGTHSYRGGPFVIDVSNRDAALPIVGAWRTNFPQLVVHEATGSFSADVGRFLVAAPRIALFQDGNQTIAFSYLNAASIPDSQGNVWVGTNSVDLVTPEAVAGPTSTSHHDGVLFDSNGVPQFSLFVSMHYNVSTAINSPGPEAIAEVGEFLNQRTLFVAECQAVRAFETNAYFLTDRSFTAGPQQTSVTRSFSDLPVAQDDGAFGTEGGSDPGFVPIGNYLGTEGREYFRIIRAPSSAPTEDVAVLGFRSQNTNAGRIFYLGGHQYTINLPISSNPASHGVRYFLNSLLFAPSTALDDGAANLATALSGPSSPTTNRTLDFTLSYQNSSAGAALNGQVTVAVPSGATASMVSGNGNNLTNQLVWNLGNIATNASGNLSFRLTLSTNGIYAINSSTLYKRGITWVTNFNVILITNTIALAATLLPADQIELSFTGDSNRNYDLETSTNLLDWTFLATLNNTNSELRFRDPTTNFPQRFYRVLFR